METPENLNPEPSRSAPYRALRAVGRGTLRLAKAAGWLGTWLPGAFLALLVAGVLVAWWWSATPGSLAQTLSWAQDWTQDQPPEAGRLRASGVQGTLREGGDIAELQWTQPGLQVQAQAVRLRWSAGLVLQLLRGRGLQLEELAMAQLRVNDQRPPSPTVPMESLTLPIGVDVPWSLGELVLEGASPLRLSELQGHYRYGVLGTEAPPSQGLVPGVDAAHQLTLDSLRLAQGRYQLQAVLGGEAPMPLLLSATGDVQAPVPGGQTQTLQVSAGVTGTLASASATLDSTARVLPTGSAVSPQASPTLAATARLRPWASQPVEQVDASTHELNLAQLWPQAPFTALTGTLQAQPNADGAWRASARLDNRASGPLDQQRLPFSRLAAEVEQRGTRWDLPSLVAQIGSAELKASGTFQPAAETTPAAWSGELKAAGLNPALLWSTLDALGLDAAASARTAADPGAVDLQARIVPAATQAATRAQRGLRLREVRVQGQWMAQAGQGGVLELQQAVVDAADLRLNMQGRADVAAKSFAGLAALKLPGLQGDWTGEVAHASGQGRLALDVDDAARLLAWLRGLQSLPVVGKSVASWLQTQPVLQRMQVSGGAKLEAQWQGGLAELGFPAPPGKSPAVRTTPLRLQIALDVPRLQGSLPGQAAAATTARGSATTAAQPQPWAVRQLGFKASGSLADLALSLQGEAAYQPWRAVIDTQARVQNALPGRSGTGKNSGGRVDVGTLQLQVQDRSRPGKPVDWALRSQQALQLGWAPGTLGADWQAGPGALTLQPTFLPGTATTASRPDAGQALTLAWDSLRWQGQSLQTRGRMRGLPLSWVDALATAEGAQGGPMAQAGVSGDLLFDGEWDLALPGAGNAPLRLTAQLQRRSGDLAVKTDTGTGPAGAGRERAPLQAGVREARLDLSAQGGQVKASLRWDSERLGQASADVATQLNTRPPTSPDTPALDHWWPASAPLSGSFKAALPQVGVWSALAPPGWRMRGTLKAEAAIAGTRGAPTWRGSLQADELALSSAVDGFEFVNGQLRATLEGERIAIERLRLEGPSGSEPGGSLEASGQAQWRQASPGAAREPLIDLEVNAKQLRVSTRPDRRLTLSGQIKAQLAGPRLQVRGKLTTDSALFILPDELAPTLGDDVIVRGGRSLPQGTSTAVQVQPDVQVDLDLGPQFEVRGRGLKTRLRGQLSVRSTPTAPTPRVLGEVRTVAGTYRAYGQQLSIETGVLRFTGPYDNPTLDISAVRPQVGDSSQRVGVQISGSAQAPRVRLFSDPELPDSEKLAWLVLGRPATGAGAEAAVLQQAALALLAGNGGQLDGGFASALGLDDIGFRGEASNADGSTSAAALTLGKQISNKLYLSYERSLAGTVGTVSMFYDVSRRLTMRARAGEENAIDLIFTLRYD